MHRGQATDRQGKTRHVEGGTSRHLGVLPASGRDGLGKARVGPDAEVVGRGRGRVERWRERGLPVRVGLATFE
jgi:hypothetical protein